MYPSQPKITTNNTNKLQTTYMSKQNPQPHTLKQPLLTANKFAIYPPKMHRISSTSSIIHFQPPTINTSLSKQFKGYRDFSKTKLDPYQAKTTNMSFNSTFDIGKIHNKDFSTHRYSCNIDIDRNSDNANSTSHLVNSLEGSNRNANSQLENRVKMLQERMKKNEQSLKFYNEEIQHFKNQFSSSTSHLLDSINTNVLTVSTRKPLKDLSNISSNVSSNISGNMSNNISNNMSHNTLSVNSINKQNMSNSINKQSMSKNITVIDSVTNSPKQTELQKKLKQIDQLKKEIKKVSGRQQTIKSDMKLFQTSIRQILTGFREYLAQSVEGLSKMQQKTKKKIFDKVTQQMDRKFKEIMDNQLQPLKRMVENVSGIKKEQTKPIINITKSSQKFMNHPILLRLREESFCMIKKSTNISPFQSYQDMIKRSIYEAMGKPVQRMSGALQQMSKPTQQTTPYFNNYPITINQLEGSNGNYDKIPFEQAETTYYIDDEGYLLDREGYYLLKDNQRIQLNEVQIHKIKQNHLLQQVNHFY